MCCWHTGRSGSRAPSLPGKSSFIWFYYIIWMLPLCVFWEFSSSFHLFFVEFSPSSLFLSHSLLIQSIVSHTTPPTPSWTLLFLTWNLLWLRSQDLCSVHSLNSAFYPLTFVLLWAFMLRDHHHVSSSGVLGWMSEIHWVSGFSSGSHLLFLTMAYSDVHNLPLLLQSASSHHSLFPQSLAMDILNKNADPIKVPKGAGDCLASTVVQLNTYTFFTHSPQTTIYPAQVLYISNSVCQPHLKIVLIYVTGLHMLSFV